MIENLKWVAWESTPDCNLNCIHCRSCAEIGKHKAMSTKDAKQLMINVSQECTPVFVLSGGEPLLRSDIFDLIDYGNSLNFKMCLASNGMLITADIAKKLKLSRIKIVSMSLDGSTAAIHDNFRQVDGSFDAVIKASKILKAEGIEFIINSSFTERNKDDIKRCYKLAKEIGAKAWYMFMIVPTGRGEGAFDELINANDYEEILNWHYDMEREEDDMLVRPTCAPHYYRVINQRSKEDKDFKKRALTLSSGGRKGCLAAQTIAFIDFEGNVKPCSYLDLSGGNILNESLNKIWNSKLFSDIRDFKSYKGKCGDCKYIKICGGCRARAYAKDGDYMNEEPFCSYQP